MTPTAHVAVRVYDNAGLPRKSRADAIGVAAGTLAAAGIVTEWHDCPRTGGGPKSPQCAAIPGARELVVRITRGKRPEDTAVSRPLGYSLVDAGNGVFATVFVERVEWLARASRTDQTVLMGRAVAHEVGHLILGTNGHNTTGLMRPVWTADELVANRSEDWRFQGDELQIASTRFAPSGEVAAAAPATCVADCPPDVRGSGSATPLPGSTFAAPQR